MKMINKLGTLLKSVLFEDIALKIFSLVLAVGAWMYIDGELMEQKSFELAMKVTDISNADSLELSSPLPKFLVTLRGPRRQIDFWSRENLRFKRKLLDNPQPGQNTVNVMPSDIEADNFKVVSVVPKEAEAAVVSFVATSAELKPVRVRIRNQPPSGFLVGKPVALPAQIVVKGLREDLKIINEVWTEEVDIGNAEQDVTVDIPVAQSVTVDDKIYAIKCADKVRVTVPIHPVIVVRQQTLEVLARVPQGLALNIDPKTVQVEIVIEERDFKVQDLISKISVYAEWPGNWERPKDATTIMGPLPVQLKFSAPPRVVVRGVNNGVLPTVSVTGALAGGLK